MGFKSKTVTISETCNFLKNHDSFLILTHSFPDGDTLGSGFGLCMALQSLGKKARVLCPDPIPQKYIYFTEKVEEQQFDAETIIAVDIADKKLLGRLEQEYGERVELSIDHHISNNGYAENLFLDPDASATCECIYNILKELGVPINKNIALALYTGISTDTGCFKFANTTANTHLIAAELIKTGINSAEINRIMFDTKTRQRMDLERLALDSMEYYFDNRCAVLTITREMCEKSGCDGDDLEGITAISRMVEGILAGVTIREKLNGNFKISIRTHSPINAAEICKQLGGGGHAQAAGCELEGDLEQAKETILKYVGMALEDSSCKV